MEMGLTGNKVSKDTAGHHNTFTNQSNADSCTLSFYKSNTNSEISGAHRSNTSIEIDQNAETNGDKQEISIRIPSETGNTSSTLQCNSLSSSSSESLCRICQLALRESGEQIQSSECGCRGYLSRVHESCLKEWVRYKGSNACEICQNEFRGVSPPTRPGVLQIEALRHIRSQLQRARPFSRRKRAILAAIVIFLVVVTCVTALLTVSAEREFQRMSKNPWVSKDKIKNTNIIFSICVGVSFFCATTTMGIVFIWLGVECCFAVHRRGMMRRAANLLLMEENRA